MAVPSWRQAISSRACQSLLRYGALCRLLVCSPLPALPLSVLDVVVVATMRAYPSLTDVRIEPVVGVHTNGGMTLEVD